VANVYATNIADLGADQRWRI